MVGRHIFFLNGRVHFSITKKKTMIISVDFGCTQICGEKQGVFLDSETYFYNFQILSWYNFETVYRITFFFIKLDYHYFRKWWSWMIFDFFEVRVMSCQGHVFLASVDQLNSSESGVFQSINQIIEWKIK